MILLVAILIGLAATIVRARLSHRSLKIEKVKGEWLVFLAVLPQILVFQIPWIGQRIPENVVPIIQLASMGGLLVFTLVNLSVSGFPVLSLGLLSNLLVIALNGGWMPVSPQTLMRLRPDLPASTWEIGSRLALSKDRILSVQQTRLYWLSDCLTLPFQISYRFVFSVGDILIAIGVFLILWSLSGEPVIKEIYEPDL